MDSGSLRGTADGLITLTVSNGPTHLGVSFRDSTSRGRSRADNQTLCPTLYSGEGEQSALANLLFFSTEQEGAALAVLQTSLILRR